MTSRTKFFVTCGFALVFLASNVARTHAQIEAAADPVDQIEQSLKKAIEGAQDSVVAITRVRKGSHGDPTDPEFVPHEYAAGVVVDREGLVLTTYHVLGNRDENEYYVWINRKPHKAVRVEAADPWTDLAVLKIDAQDLAPIQFSDSFRLDEGQFVVTVGDPYSIIRDGKPKAAWGIISSVSASAAKDPRSTSENQGADTIHHYGTLIQTDSRLQFGTSGGALLNRQGEMIGLTTSLAGLSRFQKSAGYAIPCDMAFQKTIRTLMKGHRPEFGFLGVGPQRDELKNPNVKGVVIEQVVTGTPASKAGLLVGDIITHVSGETVQHAGELFRELGKQGVGTEVLLTIKRGSGTNRPGTVIRKPVVLAKKYIATRRPEYSQQPAAKWRGMSVDFATAIPAFAARSGFVDDEGCVAVVEVTRDSPAWRAGLRPWTFISHVGTERVATPKQFFEAVGNFQGDVHLIMTANYGEESPNRTVSP